MFSKLLLIQIFIYRYIFLIIIYQYFVRLQFIINSIFIHKRKRPMYFPRNNFNQEVQANQIQSSVQFQPEIKRITPPAVSTRGTKHDVYHEGSKKNQMNELKAYFKSILSNPDLGIYRKQVIKKIMLYTTHGIDTSRMYPEMVIASATKDLVDKKIIFQYLSLYSHSNSDFARMAVNTFMKDSMSSDPVIRALAIRHLSYLRFRGRQQYIMPVLKKGLQDYSASVKKACLMGITKVITQQNRLKSQPIRDQQLLNQLYSMIRDNDSNVVCSAIEAINQIEPQGIAMSKKLTHYLMKNLDMFKEFQLPIILNYIQLYDPDTNSDEQILWLLQILQAKAHSQNSALVLSISKIFLKYGTMQPHLLQKIQKILKPCLLSFINSSLPQNQYIILKHLSFIIKAYRLQLYVKQLKKFYISEDNPTYIKKIKIQLIMLNCRPQNFNDVVTQLCQYLRDPTLIEQCMQALSLIILNSQNVNDCKMIIKILCDLIINIPDCYENICDYSIMTISTFLRKYPEEFGILENAFYALIRGVKLKQARCALLEIIGDYGEHIEDAVQLIVWSQNIIDDEIKISLLRANIKLFFKRPIQMLNIVNNLFRAILTDEKTRLPVRDYAAMLYRAMEADMQNFKKIFLSQRQFNYQRHVKALENSSKKIQTLQFNTLEIIYNKPRIKWLIDKTKYIELLNEIDYSQVVQEGQDDLDPQLYLQKLRSKVSFSEQYKKIDPDDINPNFQMSAEDFQKYWEEFEVGSSITRIIKQIDMISEETLEELFKMWHITVIASAQDEESIKQFLYMKLFFKDQIACMEFQAMKQVETMTLVVKCKNQELAGFVSKYVQDFIKLNEII